MVKRHFKMNHIIEDDKPISRIRQFCKVWLRMVWSMLTVTKQRIKVALLSARWLHSYMSQHESGLHAVVTNSTSANLHDLKTTKLYFSLGRHVHQALAGDLDSMSVSLRMEVAWGPAWCFNNCQGRKRQCNESHTAFFFKLWRNWCMTLNYYTSSRCTA